VRALDPVSADLLAAYALDAVDADERMTIDAALEGDADLRTRLAGYHETLAIIAGAVEIAPSTPSPAVWEGISASITGRRTQPSAPEFTPIRAARRRRITTRVLGVVAAGALAAAAFFGVQVSTSRDVELVAAADALQADPSAEVLTLTDSGGLAVRVVLGSDGVGYIYTDDLPELSSDRTYQLWAINDNGIISAGIFDRDGVAPFHVDGDLAGLAITQEVAGGVMASENDPVALWLGA